MWHRPGHSNKHSANTNSLKKSEKNIAGENEVEGIGILPLAPSLSLPTFVQHSLASPFFFALYGNRVVERGRETRSGSERPEVWSIVLGRKRCRITNALRPFPFTVIHFFTSSLTALALIQAQTMRGIENSPPLWKTGTVYGPSKSRHSRSPSPAHSPEAKCCGGEYR